MRTDASRRLPQRRQRFPRSLGFWFGVSLAGVGGCAGTERVAPPDPTSVATIAAIAPAQRTVFVTAARQKPRIIESIAAAGIPVATNLLDAAFVLRVSIGIDLGWSSCGTKHNVKYSLRREGASLLEIDERGWTGSCTPNSFDVLSRRLAATLMHVDAAQGAAQER